MREQSEQVNKSAQNNNLCVNRKAEYQLADENFNDLANFPNVGVRAIARQRAVMELVARGLTFAKIAAALGISRNAVAGHVYRYRQGRGNKIRINERSQNG